MAELRYRGRSITTGDVLYIQDLIAAHPQETRRALSKKLCEAWQWRQPNGALRDMVCRGMLLMLDRGGQIALPKMPIPGMGWLAYCKDTEGNIFGMMQGDPNAQ